MAKPEVIEFHVYLNLRSGRQRKITLRPPQDKDAYKLAILKTVKRYPSTESFYVVVKFRQRGEIEHRTIVPLTMA